MPSWKKVVVSGSDAAIPSVSIDAGGDIVLDADGTDILLKDDGTAFGRFKRDSSDFIIKSETNNKDIVFRGQDGGGTITALTLDMSEAGDALFNSDISGSTIRASGDIIAFNSSDERLKDNIQTDNLGLDFINELRTVTYNWKASDKVDTSLPGYIDADTTNFDKLCKDTSVTMNGLIAQEVKAALDKVGADASKYAVWSTDDDGIQRISESSFVMPLIKAVQELSAKVKALEDA